MRRSHALLLLLPLLLLWMRTTTMTTRMTTTMMMRTGDRISAYKAIWRDRGVKRTRRAASSAPASLRLHARPACVSARFFSTLERRARVHQRKLMDERRRPLPKFAARSSPHVAKRAALPPPPNNNNNNNTERRVRVVFTTHSRVSRGEAFSIENEKKGPERDINL